MTWPFNDELFSNTPLYGWKIIWEKLSFISAPTNIFSKHVSQTAEYESRLGANEIQAESASIKQF